MPAPLTHGHTRHGGERQNSPTYNSWVGMKRRCLDEDHHHFAEYGGRGITLADDWHDFDAFLRDMGPRPEGKTLDRKDNNGPYCAGNCRWATPREQLCNRRNSVHLTHDGLTLPLLDWEARCGVPYQTLWKRISRGWSHQRALTTPTRSST